MRNSSHIQELSITFLDAGGTRPLIRNGTFTPVAAVITCTACGVAASLRAQNQFATHQQSTGEDA